MFFSASPAFVFTLTVLLCIPSILVHALAHPPLWDGHARRVFEKRDTFSTSGLSLASWIWLPEPDLLTTAPLGNAAFIKTFATPAGKTAASAVIAITVDNNYTLWVNGQAIGETGPGGEYSWQTAQVFEAQLNASANVFSVLGNNVQFPDDTPGSANPAGLLAAIRVLYSDGSNDTILSDSTWLVSSTVPSDFPLPADVSKFVAAQVATQYGTGPWGTSVTAAAPNNLTLAGSAWIWNTSNSGANAPVGTIGFRKTIVTPTDKTATSATILASVDNTFQMYVNGQYVGSPPLDDNAPNSPSSWEYAQRISVSLTPSSNIFTVLATNFPPQAGSTTSGAGFIAAIQVDYTDGTNDVFGTDTTWLTGPVTSASAFLATADSALSPPIVQGTYGMAPWGNIGTVDALNALNIPGNNAAIAAGPTSSGSPTSGLAAPTTILPSFVPNYSPTPTSATDKSAGARTNGHTAAVLLFVSFVVSVVL
ncbi:hypothetical protein DFH07DRAFT_289630 [Mycena maculata]|uniref:Glycoside hydrolase family 78 protein n=1 Tax=Mycena maculata TaxID=230809 RepID=A0AAD7JS57_9AGAR|nr:hypothetical protein DFH07DRAFT_289630 [Mycena maculata]